MEIPELLNSIDQKYKDILENVEPYVLGFKPNMANFDLRHRDFTIHEEYIGLWMDSKNSLFFDALQMLDKHSFGQVGMPMDKWVFFDCGEMVGAIVGFGLRAQNLSSDILKLYKLDKQYTGLVPISMYIAIPMASGSWFGHNLCSANAFLPQKQKMPGLALLSKALGIQVMNFKEMYGATQWESKSLSLHIQIADMEIKSAYTPAHTFDKTMTYKSIYNQEKLINALLPKKRMADNYDRLVNVLDNKFYFEMQSEIENGMQFSIVGRPISENDILKLPIKEISKD